MLPCSECLDRGKEHNENEPKAPVLNLGGTSEYDHISSVPKSGTTSCSSSILPEIDKDIRFDSVQCL